MARPPGQHWAVLSSDTQTSGTLGAVGAVQRAVLAVGSRRAPVDAGAGKGWGRSSLGGCGGGGGKGCCFVPGPHRLTAVGHTRGSSSLGHGRFTRQSAGVEGSTVPGAGAGSCPAQATLRAARPSQGRLAARGWMARLPTACPPAPGHVRPARAPPRGLCGGRDSGPSGLSVPGPGPLPAQAPPAVGVGPRARERMTHGDGCRALPACSARGCGSSGSWRRRSVLERRRVAPGETEAQPGRGRGQTSPVDVPSGHSRRGGGAECSSSARAVPPVPQRPGQGLGGGRTRRRGGAGPEDRVLETG